MASSGPVPVTVLAVARRSGCPHLTREAGARSGHAPSRPSAEQSSSRGGSQRRACFGTKSLSHVSAFTRGTGRRGTGGRDLPGAGLERGEEPGLVGAFPPPQKGAGRGIFRGGGR